MLIPRPRIFTWKTPPRLSQEDLANDIERLKSIYRRYGFYHTEITPEITESRGQVKVRLIFREGHWILVTNISLSIVGQPDQQADLQELLHKSQLKVEKDLPKDFESLKEILNYLWTGYPRPVEAEVLLNPRQYRRRLCPGLAVSL
jgi:hypothetical protein